MTFNGWFQILFFSAAVLLVTKPIGMFMARVFRGERTFLDPVLRPVERLLYRLTRVDEKHEMRWTEYSIAMLLFSGVSMLRAVPAGTYATVAAVQPAEVCSGSGGSGI